MSMSSMTAIQLRSARRLRQIPTFHAIHVSHESIRVALTARQSLPAYPISGHSQWPSACLKRARSCHSRAPERSAGEPGNPSLGRAPALGGPRATTQRWFVRDGRARLPQGDGGTDSEASSTRPRRRRTTIGESDVRPACWPSTRRRDPSQPCFTIGHALSLRGRAASSAGTVASSLR